MDIVKIAGIMFVPMILFITIVVPMWLNLHYKEKRRSGRELTQDEWTDFEATAQQLEKMEQRVIALESILDETSGNWREREL